MATPLTDAINALTTYANEVTGKSDTTLSAAVGSLADGYGGGGVDWITYHSDTTVIRTGAQGQPTIPVIPGALVIIRCPDEQSGGYANIFASFSADGTKYDYGVIRGNKFTNDNRNYTVEAGATVVTPKFQVFSAWMADHTITGVPVYIVNN